MVPITLRWVLLILVVAAGAPTCPRAAAAAAAAAPSLVASALLPNAKCLLAVPCCAVGWVQLRSYERQLHALQQQDGDPHGSGSGQVFASAACAAKLEAAGVLPKSRDRHAGHAKDISDAARATDLSVKLLTARRRLYDAMEASLLSSGLTLGGCCSRHPPCTGHFQLHCSAVAARSLFAGVSWSRCCHTCSPGAAAVPKPALVLSIS